jgi:hypothetical protein
MLGSSHEFLIAVTGILVITTFIATSSDRDSLGPPPWPLPIAFDAPLCSIVGGGGRRSLTTTRSYLSAALHKDSPNRLLDRGVPGGDVEELFCGLWLFTAEFLHQGSVGRARPERRYTIDVTDLGEFMAFLRKTLVVIPQGPTQLLPIALEILGVARPHICTLEIAGKDLLEILPAID